MWVESCRLPGQRDFHIHSGNKATDMEMELWPHFTLPVPGHRQKPGAPGLPAHPGLRTSGFPASNLPLSALHITENICAGVATAG